MTYSVLDSPISSRCFDCGQRRVGYGIGDDGKTHAYCDFCLEVFANAVLVRSLPLSGDNAA